METKQKTSAAPYFDQSPNTRLLCIYGLIFSWLFAFCCIAIGIFSSTCFWTATFADARLIELILLGQNISITMCNESIGHIHSISLRWALQREGRLVSNSNLRLLTNSRTCKSNRWYSNVVVACSIIVAYAASSLTFLVYRDGENLAFKVCAPAFVTLGSAMALQASIITYTLQYDVKPPTWSAAFFDTAAACISANAGLKTESTQCLRGVHSCAYSQKQVYPQRRQRSAYFAHKEIRQTLRLVWYCALGIIIPAVVIIYIYAPRSPASLADIDWRLEKLSAGDFIGSLILICVIQSILTLTLHIIELHVNCSRDETLWRMASSKKGLKRNCNALVLMLTSWQSMVLFSFKCLIQWLYGASIMIDTSGGVFFNVPRIFYLEASIVLPVIFSTTIMFWRHKGSQPATFGHLQTLIDLIDEWPGEGDRMYWGDKGDRGEFAYAGTSIEPLGSIRMDKPYA
jgi:hypothetical protein